jgi:hypothetical protein
MVVEDSVEDPSIKYTKERKSAAGDCRLSFLKLAYDGKKGVVTGVPNGYN